MSALIQKASFGRPMHTPWIWVSCGYLMDNPQDVQWIENDIWVTGRAVFVYPAPFTAPEDLDNIY